MSTFVNFGLNSSCTLIERVVSSFEKMANAKMLDAEAHMIEAKSVSTLTEQQTKAFNVVSKAFSASKDLIIEELGPMLEQVKDSGEEYDEVAVRIGEKVLELLKRL